MEAITKTLADWRLDSYASKFDELGYDDLLWLKMMSAERLKEVTQAVGMKTGHAAKFLSYMQQLASGVAPGSVPTQEPAPAPAPAPATALQYTPRPQPQLQCTSPAAAQPSTAIVPIAEKVSLAQLLTQAMEEGLTRRDDLVDYVARNKAKLNCNSDRTTVVVALRQGVTVRQKFRQDGDCYSLIGERMTLTQLLTQAVQSGLSSRDELVDYADRHKAKLDCQSDRAAVVQRLSMMVKDSKLERSDDRYTLRAEDEEADEEQAVEGVRFVARPEQGPRRKRPASDVVAEKRPKVKTEHPTVDVTPVEEVEVEVEQPPREVRQLPSRGPEPIPGHPMAGAEADARLWDGAAAEGWTVHASTSSKGHFSYFSPDGRLFKSRQAALAAKEGRAEAGVGTDAGEKEKRGEKQHGLGMPYAPHSRAPKELDAAMQADAVCRDVWAAATRVGQARADADEVAP